MNDRNGTSRRQRRSVLWIAVAMLVIGAVGTAAVLVSGKSQRGSTPLPAFRGEHQEFKASADPQPAPPIRFLDESGQSRSLADLNGRVVLINAWATWCVPCVTEMPALDRLQAALGPEGLTVLALSQDRAGAEVVKPFYDKLGLRHLDIRLDPRGEAARALGVTALPISVLLDRDGREVGRIAGAAAWDSAEAMALIRALLAPSGT